MSVLTSATASGRASFVISGLLAIAAMAGGGFPARAHAVADAGDSAQDVVLPGDPVADLTSGFLAGGMDGQEAVRLAELLTFGPEVLSSNSGCQFYVVTTVWCVGSTRFHTRTSVGTTCIESAGVHLCPLKECGLGQEPRFKVSTATAGCPSPIPGGSCAYVSVSSLLVSNSMEFCNSLSGCACWPSLNCAARECVTIQNGLAAACPDCGPPPEPE